MGSTVEITVKDQIKDICITISDQGNGIPNDRIGSILTDSADLTIKNVVTE